MNFSLCNNLAMALGEIMNLHALATRCTSSADLATVVLLSSAVVFMKNVYLQEFLETYTFLCDGCFDWTVRTRKEGYCYRILTLSKQLRKLHLVN